MVIFMHVHMKNCDSFLTFALNHRLWILGRTALLGHGAGMDSTVCSLPRLVFGSLQVRFSVLAYFISCQLLVKG